MTTVISKMFLMSCVYEFPKQTKWNGAAKSNTSLESSSGDLSKLLSFHEVFFELPACVH